MAGQITDRVIAQALVTEANATTNTLPASGTFKNDGFVGIIVYLRVTAASGTGGLSVRINAVEPTSGTVVPLNAAPTAVIATGITTYVVYPSGGAAAAITQLTTGLALPPEFTITVGKGDASSYTYAVSYELLA